MSDKARKRGPQRAKTFVDPKVSISALGPEDLAGIKAILLDALTHSFDRLAAVKKAGITLAGFRLLLTQDKDLQAKIAGIKKADDDEMTDLARDNLRKLLLDQNVQVSLYVDKSRGGYSERRSIEIADAPTRIDPVDLDDLEKPADIGAEMALKPAAVDAILEDEIPPPEDYDGAVHDLEGFN